MIEMLLLEPLDMEVELEVLSEVEVGVEVDVELQVAVEVKIWKGCEFISGCFSLFLYFFRRSTLQDFL